MASFAISAEHLGWILGERDDPTDLCAHGDVTVLVGGETLRATCCASASALRMLRTLSEDHPAGNPDDGQQMLPHCGHFMIAEGETVYIGGCCYGVDYAVYHKDDAVVVATGGGKQCAVDPADYRREVLKFARQVEAFYDRCAPKVLPDDEVEREGYLAFWREWKRIRKEREHDC